MLVSVEAFTLDDGTSGFREPDLAYAFDYSLDLADVFETYRQ